MSNHKTKNLAKLVVVLGVSAIVLIVSKTSMPKTAKRDDMNMKIMGLPESNLVNIVSARADGGNTFTCICIPLDLKLNVLGDSAKFRCPTSTPNKARLCVEKAMGGDFSGAMQSFRVHDPFEGSECVRKCMTVPNCACGKVNLANNKCYLFNSKERCPSGGDYMGGKCGTVCVPPVKAQEKVQEICSDKIGCQARCPMVSSSLKALSVATVGANQMTVCAVPLSGGRGFRVGYNDLATGNECVYGLGGNEVYTEKFKCLCVEKNVYPIRVRNDDSTHSCGDVCHGMGKKAVATGSGSKDAYVCVFPNKSPRPAYPGTNLKGQSVCKVGRDEAEQVHDDFFCLCI